MQGADGSREKLGRMNITGTLQPLKVPVLHTAHLQGDTSVKSPMTMAQAILPPERAVVSSSPEDSASLSGLYRSMSPS